MSRASLEEARAQAAKESLDIEYVYADGVSYLRQSDPGHWDAILCHGVLHHLDQLDTFVELTASRLVDSGFLFAYEYIGPSRDEWRDEHLRWAQGLLEKIPQEYWRTPCVYPPLDLADPTEMVRSSEIQDVLGRSLRVERFWPLGGNVTVPLVASLHKGSHKVAEVLRVIEHALDLEDFLLERDLVRSNYGLFYCRPPRARPANSEQ